MPIRRVSWILILLPFLFLGCDKYYDIVIDTFTANNTNESNTYLTLIDSGGNLIAEDDDGNPDQTNHSLCSRISQGGMSSGIYYIKVEHPTEAVATSAYYGIRVVDYDPGSSFPVFAGTNETDGGSDDAVDGSGVPLNPVSIDLDQVITTRAIFPQDTDVDWFELVLP